jgi:hypothetical protein
VDILSVRVCSWCLPVVYGNVDVLIVWEVDWQARNVVKEVQILVRKNRFGLDVAREATGAGTL